MTINRSIVVMGAMVLGGVVSIVGTIIIFFGIRLMSGSLFEHGFPLEDLINTWFFVVYFSSGVLSVALVIPMFLRKLRFCSDADILALWGGAFGAIAGVLNALFVAFAGLTNLHIPEGREEAEQVLHLLRRELFASTVMFSVPAAVIGGGAGILVGYVLYAKFKTNMGTEKGVSL